MDLPIRVGCIGGGGYALTHIRNLTQGMPEGRVRLAAVTMSPAEQETAKPLVRPSGAEILRTPEELIALPDLDAVIVPTGIDSHLHFTSLALAAGKHVLCEKPVTATIQDARRMAEARDKAARSVAVGFQNTYQPSARWAKARISTGEIGAPRRATVCALWPRAESYYHRNDWAGKIRTERGWVLDSPAMNAFSHQINLVLWLTAECRMPSSRVVSFEAELYRAHDIEGYDTCAIRGKTASGCAFLFLLSHATAITRHPDITIEGEDGVLVREFDRSYRIVRDGEADEERMVENNPVHIMQAEWIDFLHGSSDASIYGVEQAAELTRLVNAVAEHCPIEEIAPSLVDVVPDESGNRFRAISGIEPLFERCLEDFLLPSETGLVEWTHPGRGAEIGDYETFSGVFGSEEQ